jgi:nucleotide-binding universal stress UspA family protein
MKDWDVVKTIVLGYDGSEGADRAAVLASALARWDDARIVVVTTFQVLTSDVEGRRSSRAISEANTTAGQIVLKLQATGIEAEPDVPEGPAGEALVRRRSRGTVAGLLLGSTSEYVVRRAKGQYWSVPARQNSTATKTGGRPNQFGEHIVKDDRARLDWRAIA